MASKPKQAAAAGGRRRRDAGAEPPAAMSGSAAAATVVVDVAGSLDRADPDGAVEGWCWSPDEPERRRELAVLLDGVEVARLTAGEPRADLAAARVGDGRHAFRVTLPRAAMTPGASATVSLRDVRSGRPVGGSRTVQFPAEAPRVTPIMAAPHDAPVLQGNLDRVSRDGWVSGWCWYPNRPGEHVSLTVTVDDEPVGSMLADNFRTDLQQAGIGDGTHGFSFALPYSALADKGTLRVAVQESGTQRLLGDPITVRLGRMAAAEDRIQDLERQLRLLRGQIDELARGAAAQHEDRAARELFGTVASFFLDLAQHGATGLAGRPLGGVGLASALEEVAARHAPITLALPERPAATICIAATAELDLVHRAIAALHEIGADHRADIVLLDDGGSQAQAALLPAVVRNLRYVRLHDGSGLMAGRNEVARAARAEAIVFLAPEARPAAGWLDELLATLEREPGAALVGGRLLREDGLLHRAGLLADARGLLRDPGDLAPAELCEHGFLRPVDAVGGGGFAVRRAALLAAGGFSGLYRRFGHAVADLCARLRGAGQAVLLQPAATAIWPSLPPGHDLPDAEPPDLSLPDEETLRLRERLRQEGWNRHGLGGGFVGHALVIDDALPRPDHDAGSIATFEQMQVLRRLGWRVTLCPAHAPALDPREVAALGRLGIEVAAPPQHASVTQYLQDHGAELDLVHVYRYSNAAMLLDRIRELAPRAKLVFATADLHFLRERRRAELAGAEAPDAAQAEELRCMDASDATIVTSDYEYDLLRDKVDPGKLVLLRWITRPAPPAEGFDARRDICFVGNFRHPPNLDGVTWFVGEVLPLARRRLPNLRLLLAGSDMPASMRDLAGEAVDALGWVPDLARLFARVRLSVAPLRFGAGFKGKVATSLAHGLPVVGSGISLEGTGLRDGDGVAVADDPQDFADAIVRLHEDAALWAQQSARGLERVAALYSPEAATSVWREMLARLDLPRAE